MRKLVQLKHLKRKTILIDLTYSMHERTIFFPMEACGAQPPSEISKLRGTFSLHILRKARALICGPTDSGFTSSKRPFAHLEKNSSKV